MRRLRKSDIRELSEQLPVALDKKADIQTNDTVVLVDGKVSFFKRENTWIPALPLLLQNPSLLPSITVDMGAVRFVTRGADIMRPGIVAADTFPDAAIVVILDETHKKPLAVGRAKLDSAALLAACEGNVVQNLHFVGDDIWNAYSG